MIGVTKTYLPNIEKYKTYIDKIYASGWVTNHGELVMALEERLKAHLGVKNLVLVANGTLALQVAYKLLGLQGEVITTPFSFVATVSSQVWEGLTPVFADIDPETLTLDPHQIEKAITKNTSAIVPVHVFGNACDVDVIQSIADQYELKVIYDAAHAFGVQYQQQSLLNYGDISVLSFHATKVFHTVEGGALVFNDDALYQKARQMINFGIEGPDCVCGLGINAKMNELQAAMGLCVLDDFDAIVRQREKAYAYYWKHLPKGLIVPKWQATCTQNYAHFPVIFDTQKTLLEVQQALGVFGIVPRRYFYPSLEKLCYLKEHIEMPLASDISKRILCLPLYGELAEEQQSLILKTIQDILKRGR